MTRPPEFSSEYVAKETTRILTAYLNLLRTFPSSVLDESQLPVSKNRIIACCKIQWLAAKECNNRQQQEAAESWWLSLSRFQPTGKGPINVPSQGTNVEILESIEDEESAKWIAITFVEIENNRHIIELWKTNGRFAEKMLRFSVEI
jgi:hypothetical protein